MKNNKIITVDADDVIFDFKSAWEKCLLEVTGKPPFVHKAVWSMLDRYNVSQHDVETTWRLFESSGFWENMDILPGADAAIKKLVSDGHEVHVITALDQTHYNARINNLARFNIENIGLHCVGHQGSKLPMLEKLKPIAFFDDNHDHHHSAKAASVPYRVLIHSKLNHPEITAHTHDAATLYDGVQLLLREIAPKKQFKL